MSSPETTLRRGPPGPTPAETPWRSRGVCAAALLYKPQARTGPRLAHLSPQLGGKSLEKGFYSALFSGQASFTPERPLSHLRSSGTPSPWAEHDLAASIIPGLPFDHCRSPSSTLARRKPFPVHLGLLLRLHSAPAQPSPARASEPTGASLSNFPVRQGSATETGTEVQRYQAMPEKQRTVSQKAINNTVRELGKKVSERTGFEFINAEKVKAEPPG